MRFAPSTRHDRSARLQAKCLLLPHAILSQRAHTWMCIPPAAAAETAETASRKPLRVQHLALQRLAAQHDSLWEEGRRLWTSCWLAVAPWT